MSIELLQKESILLLYDNPKDQKSSVSALNYLGLKAVDSLYVGDKGWHRCLRSKYAAVICDFSGDSRALQAEVLTDLLRAEVIRLSRLFILLSDSSDTLTALQHLLVQQPIDAFVVKPMTLETYAKVLGESFAQKVRFKHFYQQFEQGAFTEVIEACNRRIQKGGNHEVILECFRLQAQSYLNLEQFDQAKAICRMQAAAKSTADWVDLIHGQASLLCGELGQAKRDFYKLIKRNKDHIAALDGLYEVLMQAKQGDQAQKVLAHRASLTPNDMNKALMLVDLAMQNKNVSLAENLMYQAMQCNEAMPQIAKSQLWLKLLEVLQAQVQLGVGEQEAYSRALELVYYLEQHEDQTLLERLRQWLLVAEMAALYGDPTTQERFSAKLKHEYDRHLFLLSSAEQLEVAFGFYANSQLRQIGAELLQALLWQQRHNQTCLIQIQAGFNGHAYICAEANKAGVGYFCDQQYSDALRLLDLAFEMDQALGVALNAAQAALMVQQANTHVDQHLLQTKADTYLRAAQQQIQQGKASDKQRERYHSLAQTLKLTRAAEQMS